MYIYLYHINSNNKIFLCHGNIPCEANEEITWPLIALFAKCVPNGFIMTHKCPAPSKIPTSRALPFEVSRGTHFSLFQISLKGLTSWIRCI